MKDRLIILLKSIKKMSGYDLKIDNSIMASALVSRSERSAFDQSGAFSSGYGPMIEYCPEGVPVEQAIFGILAAFGASFGFLYRAVTMTTGGRKRRSLRADTDLDEDDEANLSFYEVLQSRAAQMIRVGRKLKSRCCVKKKNALWIASEKMTL